METLRKGHHDPGSRTPLSVEYLHRAFRHSSQNRFAWHIYPTLKKKRISHRLIASLVTRRIITMPQTQTIKVLIFQQVASNATQLMLVGCPLISCNMTLNIFRYIVESMKAKSRYDGIVRTVSVPVSRVAKIQLEAIQTLLQIPAARVVESALQALLDSLATKDRQLVTELVDRALAAHQNVNLQGSAPENAELKEVISNILLF